MQLFIKNFYLNLMTILHNFQLLTGIHNTMKTLNLYEEIVFEEDEANNGKQIDEDDG